MPSRGRIYAWGLGGAGQLGNGIAKNSTTPQVVFGPWMEKLDSQNRLELPEYVVKHIYSGGDHCFTTVTLRKVCASFLTLTHIFLYISSLIKFIS